MLVVVGGGDGCHPRPFVGLNWVLVMNRGALGRAVLEEDSEVGPDCGGSHLPCRGRWPGRGATRKSRVTSDVQFKNWRPCEHRSKGEEQEP